MKTWIATTVLSAIVWATPSSKAETPDPKNVHDFSFRTLSGEVVPLSTFKGKKILIVNTASKCGYTKQYAGLQELSTRYADRLVVIGFPSGNFREQEFDRTEEIQQFCEENYGVTFPLAEKTEVIGEQISPLFSFLTTAPNPDFTGAIDWNFEKFLIDEEGNLIRRFRSKVEPLDESITSRL